MSVAPLPPDDGVGRDAASCPVKSKTWSSSRSGAVGSHVIWCEGETGRLLMLQG